MLADLVVLVGSLLLLVLGAEMLVRGATRLAIRAGVSPLFVGLTIVGFGTSSPELAAGLAAAAADAPELGLGNVVGSNLFNIGVVLGVTALVHPVVIGISAIRRDLAAVILVSAVPWLALVPVLGDGRIGRVLGGLLVILLAGHITSAWWTARRAATAERQRAVTELEATLPSTKPGGSMLAAAAGVLVGLGLLVVAARAFVGSASSIAAAAGASDLVIGLTIVAVGTSAPELVTSIVAALRKSPDLAVGNVLGSNLFNMLGILGISSLVVPTPVPSGILIVETPLMLLSALALVPLLRSGGRITRLEGAILLGAYVVYVIVRAAVGVE